jgi:hypothetical protein
MGLFDGGFATYATWAIILALVGVLIWFFVIRKPKTTQKVTKDTYEEEGYEDEAYEDETYDEETYDEETYDEETYDEETYDEET